MRDNRYRNALRLLCDQSDAERKEFVGVQQVTTRWIQLVLSERLGPQLQGSAEVRTPSDLRRDCRICARPAWPVGWIAVTSARNNRGVRCAIGMQDVAAVTGERVAERRLRARRGKNSKQEVCGKAWKERETRVYGCWYGETSLPAQRWVSGVWPMAKPIRSRVRGWCASELRSWGHSEPSTPVSIVMSA